MDQHRLVLWDIDHTLISVGSGTREAYAAAFFQATGMVLREPWRFDGRTELAAATEALRAHGLEPDGGRLESFLDAITAELTSRAADPAGRGHVLPGAPQALSEAGALPQVHQTVLTGNLRGVAVLKLTTFDLLRYLDIRVGAFGGDAYERHDLPRHAMARARELLGREYTGAQVVVIGDTVRDVQAARAVGARCVAVATGSTSAAELSAAGADITFADLTDTAAVLRAIVD